MGVHVQVLLLDEGALVPSQVQGRTGDLELLLSSFLSLFKRGKRLWFLGLVQREALVLGELLRREHGLVVCEVGEDVYLRVVDIRLCKIQLHVLVSNLGLHALIKDLGQLHSGSRCEFIAG